MMMDHSTSRLSFDDVNATENMKNQTDFLRFIRNSLLSHTAPHQTTIFLFSQNVRK